MFELFVELSLRLRVTLVGYVVDDLLLSETCLNLVKSGCLCLMVIVVCKD
ncbi:hypothetical protein Hanom_Chr07g00608511 [Helianthus anomalus]